MITTKVRLSWALCCQRPFEPQVKQSNSRGGVLIHCENTLENSSIAVVARRIALINFIWVASFPFLAFD